MSTIITKKNEYGEIFYVKLVDGIVMVHHTDCTEDYIPMNDLILKFILTQVEVIELYNAAKVLYSEIIKPKIEKILGNDELSFNEKLKALKED